MIFFDLANISAIFQIYINKVLTDLINVSCVIYFDNIFIYLINRAEYQQYIR
jgi:predicted lactoylglutathione lyase